MTKERLYIDPWCARNVRKVNNCRNCLHYFECEEAGCSVAPRAIERLESKKEFNRLYGNEDDD